MKMSQTTLSRLWIKTRLRAPLAAARAVLIALSAFVFAGAGNVAHAAQAQNSITGQWTAEVSRQTPGEIQLTFHRRSEAGGFNMSGARFPLADMQGLNAEAIFSARADVNFNVVRQAGTFACEGYFREGKGAGFWTFMPSRSFASAMRERGYDALTDEDLLKAALHKLTTDYIQDLKSAGYDRLEFKELLRALSHGVTGEFIRELNSAGYQNLTMKELVRARNHNIGGRYIDEVRAMGFDKQPLEKLIRLRNHKITQEFITRMRSAGFDNLSVEQLIRLRNHEITPEFVNEVKAEGYADIPVETAIRLKNHNVDGGFIKRVKARGFTDLTLEQIIRLRTRDIVK